MLSFKQASSNQVSRLRCWWFICGWPSFQCHKICFFRFSLSPPSIFLVSLLFYSFIYEKTIGHSSSILAIPFLNDAVSFSRTRFRFCVFFCGCLTFFPSLFNWFLWVSKYLVKTGSYISWNAAYTHYTKIQRIVLCACVCVCVHWPVKFFGLAAIQAAEKFRTTYITYNNNKTQI